MKSFVREIPGSLFDCTRWDRWMAIADIEDTKARSIQLRELLIELDMNRRAMITVLFFFIKELVRNHKHTRMVS